MKSVRFLFLLSFYSFLFSNHSFQNLTVRDGLSDDQCTSLSEDGHGFIWVGTNEGLNRYDGYSPQIYRSNPFDSTALSGNRIFGTYTDNNGDLWVSTEKSIDKYNLGNDQFKRHDTGTSPTFIVEDTLGYLWVATLSDGLYKVNINSGKTSHFSFNPLDPTSISSNQFSHNQKTSIIIDKNNNIWVGTSNGLNFFDRKTENFIRFYSKNDNIGTISSNIINTLHYDGLNLWIGTPNGLDRIDTETMAIERQSGNKWSSMLGIYNVNQIVPFKTGVPMEGFWMATIGGLVYYDKSMSTFQDVVHPDIFGRYVSSIYSGHNGDLWIYVPQSEGVIQFKTTNFYLMYGFFDPQLDFTHVKSIDNDIKSLGSNKINDILFNQNETTWFATDKGISRLLSNSDIFNLKWPTVNANSISIARDNSVWFSHDNGITTIDNNGNESEYKSDPTDENSLLTSETGKILVTKKGEVWAASKYGGVTVLDQSNRFTRYENDNLSLNSLIPEKINTIYEDNDGTIWLASLKGVSKFINGKFNSFYYNPALKNDHLSDINAFLYDHNKILWVGTNNNGLYTLDYEDLSIIEHYTLDQNNKHSFSSSTVLSIYEDSDNKVWIGTGGEGLFQFDKNINGFKRYSIDDGLPSNTIASIIEDKQKMIWMGTRNGITRLEPESIRFQNYNLSDGLKDRVFFNQSIGIDNYGKLYIGSPQGVHKADPNLITQNPDPPRLAMVKIIGIDQKNNRKSLDFSNDFVEVDYQIQTIELEYVGLSFTKSEKNNYKYTLENHLDSWVENGTSRIASFQGLEPGEYKFIYMASNNDGLWSPPSDAILIKVYPPLWKTWWAFSGYLGLAALAVFGSVRRRDQTQAKKLEENRRIAELEEARQFQLKMLPKKFPNMLGLDIAAGIKTASEVGGDYYDFFPQKEENSLYVVVGDATGHGMTAGMMVSITKAGLMGSPHNIPPNEISFGLNRIIKDIELGKNKMAINIAKFWSDRVEFTSAAMPPVYHYKAKTDEVDELLLEGLPLGSFKGETYSLLTMDSNIGDAFIFISDGLPEAINKNDDFLGYKAVLECIRNNGKLSSEEIKQSLFDLGSVWLDGIQNQDDITIVVIKKLK